eukprot:TRINITY_DN7366_c0_g1_i2.p1 TRINITY_DN7366_c0_g1~~TRINITY_DN7366_c0_g1_i2.p1  ORF type:complete len:238 (-),score=44.41 TRINITY_DN7366_c0_g1_i2:496-1209(-)
MLKDILEVLRMIQGDGKSSAVTRYFEITTPFAVHIPAGLEMHSIPFFMYTAKIVTNDVLIQDECSRDDFYFLQFKLTNSFEGEYVSLRLTGLTGNYPSISFPHVRVDPVERLLHFDNLVRHCFSPRKRLPWARNAKDLFGDIYKVELAANNCAVAKYLCFDYFSYENYLTALIEIGYYQKVMSEKTVSDKELGEAKQKLNSSGAFTDILARLKGSKHERVFSSSKKKYPLVITYGFA